MLGKKTTPIENPVTLQGGYGKREQRNASRNSMKRRTGSRSPKHRRTCPVGCLGIVPPESSPLLVKLLSKFFFENNITGVKATLELAKPASEIEISEFNLEVEEGLALKLPVKVRLENPFLGSSCYVGSSSAPIIWNLTTGETNPPEPYTSINGTSGETRRQRRRRDRRSYRQRTRRKRVGRTRSDGLRRDPLVPR